MDEPQYRIRIRDAQGNFRDAKSFDEVKPGETGIMEPLNELSPSNDGVTVDDANLLLRMASFFGMQASDFIEGAAKAFGIPPCAVCQLTKQVLYSIKQIGVLKSTILLMKTFAGRFGVIEAERIQSELNEALNQRTAR